MSEVRVIDATIPPIHQERPEKLVLDNDRVAWTFVPSANFGTSK